MLPNINITFANGAIGTAEPMDDGCSALIHPAAAVGATFALNTPYLITCLQDLDELGIQPYDTGTYSANNALYRQVADFYSEAPKGTHLWLMGIATSTATADFLATATEGTACHLLRTAHGEIRTLMVKGIDDIDIDDYADALQQLCEWAADTLYAPCLAITDYADASTTITNLATLQCNRVAVVNSYYHETTGADSHETHPALALLGGRLAAYPIEHSAGRVKNGKLKRDDLLVAYNGSDTAPEQCTHLDDLHTNAFITARNFIGLAGQYFNDDRLCTTLDDDYAYITRRRTIDKAYRLAYKTLVTEIGDHVPVTNQGTPVAAYCKAIEAKVESAIANSMTANGNLGTDPADPNDLGVRCTVDHTVNLLQTSRIDLTLQVKPYGYARYIDVSLGFLIDNNQ